MDDSCYICGKEIYTENLCYDCYVVLKAMYNNYTAYQLMMMFSHVLGIKIVEDIVKQTSEKMEKEYWSEYAKNLKSTDLQ